MTGCHRFCAHIRKEGRTCYYTHTHTRVMHTHASIFLHLWGPFAHYIPRTLCPPPHRHRRLHGLCDVAGAADFSSPRRSPGAKSAKAEKTKSVFCTEGINLYNIQMCSCTFHEGRFSICSHASLLERFEWEDRYCCHVCTVTIKLQTRSR